MAHGDVEVAFIVDAFKAAVREMQAGELPSLAVLATSARNFDDALSRRSPGARLGRDAEGNPAWFVPNPEAPGKYLQLS